MWVFVASLMVINLVYERDARAISSAVVRRGVSCLRAEGGRDCVVEEKKRLEEEKRGS